MRLVNQVNSSSLRQHRQQTPKVIFHVVQSLWYYAHDLWVNRGRPQELVKEVIKVQPLPVHPFPEHFPDVVTDTGDAGDVRAIDVD